MSNNETLADILAKMRRHVQAARDYPQDIDITDGDVEDWADRIEAAAARERDTGNAAALRRALEDTEELLEHFAKPGTMLHSAFFLHMRDNRAALAAPPRNCDRFKAADEARMAFWDTHETIWDAFKNRGGTELFYEVLDWLFAPAESSNKKEGGAK